jgi:sugar phosphate isomerase/epimerase
LLVAPEPAGGGSGSASGRLGDRGDGDGYDAAIGPTMPVSRLLFEPPTAHHKAGIAFLARLKGLQEHFSMLGGFQQRRPAGHLIAVFEQAAGAGVFRDPDLAGELPARQVGVVIDSYHVWWDPRSGADTARAAGRIAGYQVCDWVVPLPADALLGRGHLGDGSIDFRALTGPVLDAGYAGFIEVEITNEKVWDAPADQTAATVKERFAAILG